MERKDYRLAAIIYTDIAGFSKMMEKNESRTLELLHKHNELIEEIVKRRHGTVIKTIGDAFLIDFKNTVEALQTAIEIQFKLYEYNTENADLPLLVRIGLHLGDIYFYENDALGEGINIAARLQSIAHPGCICMSQDVYNLVLNKVDFTAEKLGRVSLKNITKEIHAYEIATPNVEFDPNRDARPILRPEKTEKLEKLESEPILPVDPPVPATAPAASAPAASAAAEDIKRRIMMDIKAAGRRLSADQMMIRYGAEGPAAAAVVEELAAKGILLKETAPAPLPEPPKEPAFSERAFFRDGELNGAIHEVKDAVMTAVGIAREEYRAHARTYASRTNAPGSRDIGSRGDPSALRPFADGENVSMSKEEKQWEKKAADSHFKSSAEDLTEYDAYAKKIRAEGRSSKAGFVAHLIPFVAVNGSLMVLNAISSPTFPWALFPFGGWGIGILEHFASVLRKGDRVKDLDQLPPLNAEQLHLFKRMQKMKDSMWHHFSSNLSTSAFLLMINAITSSGFLWSLIPIGFMTIGLLTHLGGHAMKKRELEGSMVDSFGLTGSWGRAVDSLKTKRAEGIIDLGPYADLVSQAQAARKAISAQVGGGKDGAGRKKKKGSTAGSLPVDDELLPVLDSYVEQVSLLARRTVEVDRIIEMIPVAELKADKENLLGKMALQTDFAVKREYEKNLGELERQETSFSELKNQRELLELKMRSSVNTLKQMQIDLARLAGMAERDETISARTVQDKTKELNGYLADLRAGYEELERLEEKAGSVPVPEASASDDAQH